jgi:chromosomal replication initiator protein
MSKDVLSTVVTLLTEKVGQERYDLWFGAQTRFSLEGSNLLVETPNRFLQDWQRQHYRGTLEAAYREALADVKTGEVVSSDEAAAGQAVAVEFRVNEALAAERTERNAAAQSDHSGPGDSIHCAVASGGEETDQTGAAVQHRAHPAGVCTTKRQHRPVAETGLRLVGPVIADSKAVELSTRVRNCGSSPVDATPRRRFATLDAFIVGAGNRLAHTSAQMVAERPGCMTPLLVYGPHGTGKTHLLESICSAARAGKPNLNCVYLSAEQFTTFYVGAARGGGMPSFRRKYRAVDLLLIDDLQFLVGKKGTLVELLHTIDSAMRDGRQLVFAADRAPAGLSGMGTELSTRLAGGMVCSLELPDQQTRIGLVQQFGRRMGIELSDDVAEFVGTHVTAGAREICGAVKRLHAASRMLECAIDRTFAQEHLNDLLHHASRAVRLADIERAVCDVFQLPKESLQSQRRAKQVSMPRMLAMWLARKYTRAGLAEIGEYFGRRSHSTVISAQKRVADLLSAQSEIDMTQSRCKVDEALRRVEAQLRTA